MVKHFRRLAGYLREDVLRCALRDDTAWFDQAAQAEKQVLRFSLRIVQPRENEHFVSCVPLVPLKMAAGAFGDPGSTVVDEYSWVAVDTRRKLRKGMFVAQVVGKSMEPSIPDGSYCLFSSPVSGTRQGKTVLVQLLDEIDPETGERFTVKRYESEKVEAEDGTWRHVKITLLPWNRDFDPIELTYDDEGRVMVVAELVEVLG